MYKSFDPFGGGRLFRHSALLLGLVAALATPARASAQAVFVGTGNLNDGRYAHAAVRLHDERVFVVGGWGVVSAGYFVALSSAESYDFATGTFAPTGSMAQGRIGPVAVVLDSGKVLVAGGWGPVPQGGYRALSSAELYDPQTGNFSPTGGMQYARQGMTAMLLTNGTVLIAGGSDDSGDMRSVPVVVLRHGAGAPRSGRRRHEGAAEGGVLDQVRPRNPDQLPAQVGMPEVRAGVHDCHPDARTTSRAPRLRCFDRGQAPLGAGAAVVRPRDSGSARRIAVRRASATDECRNEEGESRRQDENSHPSSRYPGKRPANNAIAEARACRYKRSCSCASRSSPP